MCLGFDWQLDENSDSEWIAKNETVKKITKVNSDTCAGVECSQKKTRAKQKKKKQPEIIQTA